jgi:hypothetical protein
LVIYLYRIRERKIMDNGPDLWMRLLASVCEIYEKPAYIAGGAVRDFNLGQEPKDIDIFLDCTEEELDEKSPELGFGPGHMVGNEDRHYKKNVGKIQKVLEFFVLGQAVQLIGHKFDGAPGIHMVFDHFDLNICKAGFVLGEGMVLTPQFEKDKADKTITMAKDDKETWENSYERARLIGNRLGGAYTLIDPYDPERAKKWLAEKEAADKRDPFGMIRSRKAIKFANLRPNRMIQIDLPNLPAEDFFAED